jgi:hypothetical protein
MFRTSIMLLLTVVPISLFAQIPANAVGTDGLCVGAYFTEAQGAAFLKAQEPQQAEAWRSRADSIRQRILKGARLGTIPSRPNSVPVIHTRREMDGYTVEKV